ncbi:MAG TPA: cupin domain-containing protein [Aggregatilineales bacterium]|nr:cupin domain-containing protein [Aggregatilineales bacterium]
MIVKNYLDSAPEASASHGGKGLVSNVRVLDRADFSTALRFVIYTELEPGTSIGYHQHGDDEGVYVILRGRGTLTVNGQTRPVKAGDTILNKPGWSHGLENDSDGKMEILVFEVGR